MKNKKIIVAASGYFDPIHSGHINYLRRAKNLGDELVVILNTDKQAKIKKGHHFMPVKVRKSILEAIKYVDRVFVSIDKDHSVVKSLGKVKPNIFAKGGDKNKVNIPEREICKKLGIKIVDGLGSAIGKQSSSKIIKEYILRKGCGECARKI